MGLEKPNKQKIKNHIYPSDSRLLLPKGFVSESKKTFTKNLKTVAVIGSGWSGFEAALAFCEAGYIVTIFEQGEDLVPTAANSSKYTGRTHIEGFHYPRSATTRMHCRSDYDLFIEKHAAVLVPNRNSYYGLVKRDGEGNKPKINLKQFHQMRKTSTKKITLIKLKKSNLLTDDFQEVFSVEEPGVKNGQALREYFRDTLMSKNIKAFKNMEVLDIYKEGDKFKMRLHNKLMKNSEPFDSVEFDHIVNATGFRSNIPKDFSNNPLGITLIYQPVVGLRFEDTKSERGEFSMLALDGANPCLMYNGVDPNTGKAMYTMTDAASTILMTCKSSEDAWRLLQMLPPNFVECEVLPIALSHMRTFIKRFSDRFKFIGYNEGVIAKPVSRSEIRTSFCFTFDGIAHIFPGKMSNAGPVAKELVKLISGKNENVKQIGAYSFLEGGRLAEAFEEIKDLPDGKEHNTCFTSPYDELNRLVSTTYLTYSKNPGIFWHNSNDSYDTRNSRHNKEKSGSEDLSNRITNFSFNRS
ncbi:MAG: hypothetical protein A3E88_06355 [Legionellales bacterium RIFCSPHIGHO2_12_FULL_35_11]|nr:MAG: hypothetical protein A3E88_06355 [Legionellales bacterium RIFCSPHIGHO2_12_FULL_35_11]